MKTLTSDAQSVVKNIVHAAICNNMKNKREIEITETEENY